MQTSIIICTRNRWDDLKQMLVSVQHQTEKPYELVIVDSSTTPLTMQLAFNDFFNQTQFPHIRLVYVHTKPGLTYQRNIGIQKSTGEILYFFDDDVVLMPDYLAQMQQIFIKYPSYGGGMGSVRNMDAKKNGIHRWFRIVFLLPRDYASGMFTWSGMPTHAYGSTQFKTVQVLGGCCMVYRRTALSNNTFDEKLHGYGYMEDCDFSRRTSYHYPLFFNPAAQLYHYNSPISRDAITANRAMFIQNYSYLFFKNVYPRNRCTIIFYWWSVLGLFLEAIIWRRKADLKGYVQGLKAYYS